MKYWTFKHKPGSKASEESSMEFVEKAIKLNSAIMQYEYTKEKTNMVSQQWNSIQFIAEGDYIFLRGDDEIYAVGKVVKPRPEPIKLLNIKQIIKNKSHGDYISGQFKGVIHFDDSPVFYEDLRSGEKGDWGQRIDVDSWKYYFPQGIYAKSQDFYKQGSNEFGVVKELTEQMGKEFLEILKTKFMEEEIKILEANKNIVLTGAPGTGKTHLAKKMALKMIFGKDNEELLSDLEREKLKGQYAFIQFHPSYDYTDFVEGLRPNKEPGKEMTFKLTNGIFKEFCRKALIAFQEDHEKDEDQKRKFVFIIDEINRGEISKIFGELFFAIDPGYRGEKGKIKTQYHNINTKDDFVDPDSECFYIPQNVYIIGTMNDIDRSVESFDFAMRGRFAWIEIKPEDRISMWDGQIDKFKEEAGKKMEALNSIIKENNNLGSHFQIGPAYFLKLKEYEGNFGKLWNNHLGILLSEYLRGIPNAEAELEKLKVAYGDV